MSWVARIRERSRSRRRPRGAPRVIYRLRFSELDDAGDAVAWPWAYFLTERDANQALVLIASGIRQRYSAEEIRRGWDQGRWIYNVESVQ